MTRELFLLSPYRVPTHHTLTLTDDDTAAFLNGYLALWHPAALGLATQPPRISPQYDHEEPHEPNIYAVPVSPPLFLPDDWEDRLRRVGAVSFRATPSRDETVANLLAALALAHSPAIEVSPAPFHGIGLGYILLEALFEAMDHAQQLSADDFFQDVKKALAAGDAEASRKHLLSAAGRLREARDILYPSNIHLLDLAIVADVPPATALDLGTIANFLLPAERLAGLAKTHPQWVDKLRERIHAEQAEVCGGPYRERDDALLPLESQLWNLRKGLAFYAQQFGREIQVHGRKHFAASPHLPDTLAAFGLDKTLLLALDDGVLPQFKSAVIEWNSPASRRVLAITQKPLPADNPATYLHLAHHLARTIRQDFTAALTLLHSGKPEAPWYRDWLELNRLAAVFGELTMLSRFLGDVPAGEYPPTPKADDFHTNYLHTLVEQHAPCPVSRFAVAARVRRRLEATCTLAGLYRGLTRQLADNSLAEQLDQLEEAIELGAPGTEKSLDALERQAAALLSDRLLARPGAETPGFLVVNPCSFSRRIPVELEGVHKLLPLPAKATQLDAGKARAVVEVPALGFAWLPAEVPPGTKVPMPRGPLVEERLLRNEWLEAEIDERTGGLRLVRDLRRGINRLGQQLVYGPGSVMTVDNIAITSSGPALAEIVSTGTLRTAHDELLANWQQRYRIWWGRPLLEMRMELEPVSPPVGYPWHAYYGARFAWRDASAALFRGVDRRVHQTTHGRPESPDFVEIRSGPYRTAILTGGLPFCQRQGPRMLDVILLPEGETARAFHLAIGIDCEEPAQVADEWLTPAVVVPTRAGPPHVGASGWLFHIDAPNVLLTTLRPAAQGTDAVVARLVECDGVAIAAELRCARNPTRALLIDERDRTLAELPVTGDIVALNLAAYDMQRVHVEFS